MTHFDPIYGIQSLLTRLEVSNTLLTALIDSGAVIVISVIRKSTLVRIVGSLGCLEKPEIQAASVNGVPLCFVGKLIYRVDGSTAAQNFLLHSMLLKM